jgi:HAD superfamily hydrolase (TIGR01549 family)
LSDVRDRYLEIFGTLSVDAMQEQYHTINAPLWEQYADGEIDKATVKQQRFARLLDAVGAPHADAGRVQRYYMQRYAEHWRFVPGARDAFRRVADHMPVGVLTNGFSEVQAKKLDRFPVLRDQSSAVVVCEEHGPLKPHPDAFAHATAQADAAVREILYVGDSWRSDVQGGRNAGWQVAWYTPNGTDGRAVSTGGFDFGNWDVLVDRLRTHLVVDPS